MILASMVFHVLFLLVSVFICLKTIGYAMYEINTLHNKLGGIAVIAFSVLVVLFTNVIVWLN